MKTLFYPREQIKDRGGKNKRKYCENKLRRIVVYSHWNWWWLYWMLIVDCINREYFHHTKFLLRTFRVLKINEVVKRNRASTFVCLFYFLFSDILNSNLFRSHWYTIIQWPTSKLPYIKLIDPRLGNFFCGGKCFSFHGAGRRKFLSQFCFVCSKTSDKKL